MKKTKKLLMMPLFENIDIPCPCTNLLCTECFIKEEELKLPLLEKKNNTLLCSYYSTKFLEKRKKIYSNYNLRYMIYYSEYFNSKSKT
jgi:hypothetical protein